MLFRKEAVSVNVPTVMRFTDNLIKVLHAAFFVSFSDENILVDMIMFFIF